MVIVLVLLNLQGQETAHEKIYGDKNLREELNDHIVREREAFSFISVGRW
jgi:hypothetical protein